MKNFRVPLKSRPLLAKNGEAVFAMPKNLVDKNDEMALGASFVCNRSLFGAFYRRVMPDLFESMGQSSGVLIALFIPSPCIMPTMNFPGDIDLLVIPYESDELLISETLAIELKVVRAKFSKQGKSPNEYGFSQAEAMLKNGFPYSAVVHLVISDDSPEEYWRETWVTQVVDADKGTATKPWVASVDMLPLDLMGRCFGRLLANCDNDQLGLAAVYIKDGHLVFPKTKAAKRNASASPETFEAIATFYEKYFQYFLDTPKY